MDLTIGLLVTNCNTWELAKQCLDANLSLCGDRLTRIVLMDDCSTVPQSVALDARVEVVRNDWNLGLVKTLNKGMSLLDTDIVALFDSDAYPLNDYTGAIREAFEDDPALALVGFATVGKNGRPTASFEPEPGLPSLVLGQSLSAKYQRLFGTRTTDLCIYTCAMAFRRKAVLELGGFDENFDWLDLDLDLSMRITRSAWTQRVISSLTAFHEGSGTPQLTSSRVLRFYKNRWYLLRKHNKIANPAMAKQAIMARLRVEFLFLKLAGKWLYRDAVTRRDKIDGRQRIIEHCKQNYI